MKYTYKLNTLIIAIFFSINASAQCKRATVIDNYQNIYLKTVITPGELAWTGDKATCKAGDISAIIRTKTLNRINYFRELCGLPGNITFDATLNPKCQQAALMMYANNKLDHNPPSSWLCYTTDGAAAANKSNLSMGNYGPSAVSAYIDDYGTSNTAAGHRRWILYTEASKFGHGCTNNSDALWVVGNNSTPAAVDFVAFPSAGFFPAPLVPSSKRWSFGKPKADFSLSKVEMRDEKGAIVPVTLEPLVSGRGDNTIVWVAQGIVTNSPTDVTYTVKVTNVKVNNQSQDYTYSVVICQPTHPPVCPPKMAWSENECRCRFPQDIEHVTLRDRISIVNPFFNQLQVTINNTTEMIQDYHVYDVMGRKLNEQPSLYKNDKTVQLTWETANWPKGMYLVELVAENGAHELIKMMKQ